MELLKAVALFSLSFLSVLWVTSFTSPRSAAVLRKLYLFTYGFLTMLFSTDKRWSKPRLDPEVVKDTKPADKKLLVFIRHGESDWNEVFNRGFGPTFFVRLVKAIYREMLLLVTSDSVFIDSSLSPLGVAQARDLLSFLDQPATPADNADLHALLRGENSVTSSVVVSSNLRRALATAAIGLQPRLKETKERVLISSDLQEISFNLDANALAPPLEVPDLHAIAPEMWASFQPSELFDPGLNSGNKPIFGNGLQRMHNFCEFVFSREEDAVIAVGHSLYFRSFFRTFLPFGSDHEAKRRKMANAGAVAFELSRARHEGRPVYRIDPASISVVYGGFAK
uniref:Uncharacterized protein n=1 Tax=Tetraselmis sp. GSL018 TaxID=582737 RepID=A0A061RFY4_9CHLO